MSDFQKLGRRTTIAVIASGWIAAACAQNCHNVDVRGDQPFGEATNQLPVRVISG